MSINNSTSLNETDNKTLNIKVEWTIDHEKIMTEWGDRAMCYRWLHLKAHNSYSTYNTLFTIPVIIISTLTGTANFAQQQVPIIYQSYFFMIVGFCNISAGIISTIAQYLKIAQLNESHRVSSISWDKFYRNIKIELGKHPDERIDITHFMKFCKEEYDRLIETSPNIPNNILNMFKSHFEQKDIYEKITKPEICDSFIPTNDYRNPWFVNVEKPDKLIELELIKLVDTVENKNKTISDFINLFKTIHNRMPLDSEVYDSLNDKVDVLTIKNYLLNNSNNTV
jgi:hypothetical protein